MSDNKIIEKLRRLLAMANDSRANEHEAEIAMAKAQELLAEHNLSMSSVVASGGNETEKRERSEIEGLKHGNGRGAMYQYQRNLMAAIAQANFCYHWIETKGKVWNGRDRYTNGVKSHMLIGRESNVIACRIMFEYLNETMERLVPYQGKQRLSRSAISWKDGCASRLIQRIHEQAWQRRQESKKAQQASGSTANALVVVLDDVYESEANANLDVLYGWAPGTMARKRAEYKAAQEKARAEREANPDSASASASAGTGTGQA